MPQGDAPPQQDAAIVVDGVSHRYGPRAALTDVRFAVRRGELFGLLGPNGGGKSTLFRILATLQRPTSGSARVMGRDVLADPAGVRRAIGVVFQHPSLDGKLTVEENLRCHGHLFGLGGRALEDRIAEQLERFGVAERRRDRVDGLSGGLMRRVELAKGLLPGPAVVLLDEPSAGLDPAARRDVMTATRALAAQGTTVLVTTHHMDEAERCDRVAILDAGRVVALDTPAALTAAVGAGVVVIEGPDPGRLAGAIEGRFHVRPTRVDGTLRVEHERGHELVRDIVDAFPDDVRTVTFARPSLEDVFLRLTGHRFDRTEAAA